jgi:beta-N-acetylhexosaminidase
MVMALGTRETQEETLDAIAAAIEEHSLDALDLSTRLERLDRLAIDYPCEPCAYEAEPDDRALMAHAWRRALTPYRAPRVPQPGAKIRLVARADVVSDGVSEAGISAIQVAEMLARAYEVETVTFGDADTFDWNALPQDGRFTILASTSRARYGEHARANWRPDLHLALWNPFQALDIAAPALITYGSAQPALDAVAAWLSGEVEATGCSPVAGFLSAVC